MKNFFYSLPVNIILYVLMFYLIWNYLSLPTIILWAFFLVIYGERSAEYRKQKRLEKQSK
jgi:hypothetical protein